MKRFAILTVFLFVLSLNSFAQTRSDAALARILEQDKTSRDANGKLLKLSAAEHLARADVYSTNRHFPEARAHWQKILDNYPNDANMPKVLFGIGRSYMWERDYAKAVFWFDRLTKDFLNTKDGREGLAFKGASLVRMSKNAEAAQTYQQYTMMFPYGEKIETSHLNIIDALREAKKYDEANIWVDKTRQRFPGMPPETNALQARLRMEIFRQKYDKAVVAADELLRLRSFADSMTSANEVLYLKAFALEKSGKRAEAIAVYSSIPNNLNSYYGGLAAEKLNVLSPQTIKKTSQISQNLSRNYPVLYRAELLRHAKSRSIDPRFVLAIMKQESSFRADAKSPAAARGLLQLVFDTALKYNKQAGYPNLQGEDLYRPDANIAIGSVYIAELKKQFGGLYEAIAASYNGGEDNAARWLDRSRPKDAGIFASEVGFSESKNYVFKVMNNYRVYRELYTEDLIRK
ncbi:MAG TPA: transglycosylase SLT domain-containing protein [Pyrinomonadaceae bacterium]|nr:transglycosylase SLT domain-containing protein [Pyrinomonadaceae bacterium]